MTKSLENEEEKESVPLSRTPPPYYNQSVSTPYYCDRDLDNITYHTDNINVSDIIDSIFNQLNKNTCLNFTRNKESRIKNTIGINFNISNSGNTVELSKSKDCPTNMSLFKEVYLNKEHLLFFIGIALNITPEIKRPDSNDDVTVNRSNVNNTFYELYYKQNELNNIFYINGTDFDFKSPMFVDPYFLSNSSEPTYTFENKLYKDYQYFKGITRPFRFNDYKHIFYYYCNATQNNDCMYGGYKPNNSIYNHKCKCPEYLTGNKCENFFTNNDNCTVKEQNITATSEKKFFNLTITKGRCYFNITSQNGKNVSVTIENLAFEKTNCSSGQSFLEVLVRNDKGAGGINFCNNTKNKKLPALSNQVFLVFSNEDQNLTLNASFVEESENNSNGNNKQ
uniref:Astacin domain-containing protein n=1 Tax=Strongyloides papillosus TaxID=174720 RepID=A0A0N5BHB6_STREA